MTKGVSCLCLTYGRTSLLEEAVESFLRQQWDGPKELVVVNDHPEQELLYAHDEVIIFNINRRLRTLGEKRNLSVALARYEYLFIWDDDDIHLPWRIEETMKTLPEAKFFKCPRAWLMNNGRLESRVRHGDFFFHCAAAYSRYIFEQIRGYRFMNKGEDQDFENRMRLSDSVKKYWKVTHLPDNLLYYIYRWEHGYYHASNCEDLREIEPGINKGKYQLQPHWKADYCEEVSKQIERMAAL